MNEDYTQVLIEAVPNQQRANELMSRLFDASRPAAVFSEPVQSGQHTVITASEVSIGLGFGYGGGAGTGSGKEEDKPGGEGSGFGGGGGGGGGAMARPVAAVIIGPDGVRVEPIVDPTKIALALFTTVGSMFMMFGRMRKSR